MSQQQSHPKKKRNLTDLILFGIAILLLFIIPWSNMNSFHYLLLFLYVFCCLMRITNIRKMRMRQMAQQQKNAEQAKANQTDTTNQNPS